MNIGEMFVRLGVKADTFTVKDFGKAVGDIPFAVAGAVASLAGFSLGFMDLAKGSIDTANSLRQFHSITGLSVDEMVRWQSAAEKMGAKGEDAMGAVMHISQALAAFKMGHADAGFLQGLGFLHINPNGKDAFELLKEALTTKQFSNAGQRSAALKMLGVDSLASLSDASQLNKFLSNAPAMTGGDVKELQRLQEVLTQFETDVIKGMLPSLEKLIPSFEILGKAMTNLIEAFAPVLAEHVGGAARIVKDVNKGNYGAAGFDAGAFVMTHGIYGFMLRHALPTVIHQTNNFQQWEGQASAEMIIEKMMQAQKKAHKSFNNHEKVN